MKKFYGAPRNQESGFAFVLIILVVVLVFSITLVSGADKFVLSEEKPRSSSSGTGNAPTPTPGGSGSAPTATPGTNVQGAITVTLQGCRTTKEPRMEAQASVISTTAGSVILETQNGANYTQVVSIPFSGGNTNYNLLLHNDLGFNTNNWRLRLVSNGNTAATYDGAPTNC